MSDPVVESITIVVGQQRIQMTPDEAVRLRDALNNALGHPAPNPAPPGYVIRDVQPIPCWPTLPRSPFDSATQEIYTLMPWSICVGDANAP